MLLCLLSTFSPNSPLPHDHLTGAAPHSINCREGRCEAQPTGAGGLGRAMAVLTHPTSAPRACPAAAGRGAQRTATTRPSARELPQPSPARPHSTRPARAGGHRGQLRGKGRERGRRLTHAYTRPSASSTPSPPYRGTCVQQPSHIRVGPARLLRRPRLLPGRRLEPEVHPGRARVTWRADVGRQKPDELFLALLVSGPWLTELGCQKLHRWPPTLRAAAWAGPWNLPTQ